ncbi:Hsp20/alpha crystallin family protein [Mesorhizobium sp. M7A.F.Ca.CA.001.09.2.1]|uniref:Heat shock protein Hsp20 n=7 Tax=Mesorhizobium TaxID=68287 RepID=E8TP42_MESCW|nr:MULTISPECIES: Hsp20/alpha crystallin family protein [Mesorhizobium]RUY51832.1 Hsp20/alpha crystallin family protein [Mesorhizobium sp. M7A.F.Ca.CA.001.13.2.1]RUZ82421.1 Hsp20/alpha crystallin family protein [Mesorhizobium sp. M7A.F.Ca.US.003.02.2.1]RVA42085.1 Hsp20/alpha crystallin family protein [Mesorhizobium sp. M7A.F.Ca.US.001.01.1.1]RVB48079.1 Hsp20/alpha crystallin family protein [Mesorhizobium sp. M7A.F.Ca.CA.004.05.1.1]RWO39600.1 MAG: Hsp20/alpha crystallin family protein [Mesorhizo
MSVRDLIPWGRGNGNSAPSLFPDGDRDPFVSLHREVNRLFDDAFRSFGARLPAFSPSFAATWPSVEISDTDKEVRVTAEIPGLDESDIEVLLDNGALKLKGEKRSETEDKDRQFSERFYGRFERLIPLGYEVEEDKVNAAFKNGVLTVTLPKTERAQAKAKRIAINGKN